MERLLFTWLSKGDFVIYFFKSYTHKNPAYEGPNGRTCLHAAIIRNDKEMTGKLLEWKRELTKVVDDQGCTPLHLAASMGRTLIAKQLLECDRSAAYIKEKEHKRTALHFAAHYGHEGVMKNIIRECPDCCELVDDKHQNILHTAIMKGQVALGHIALKDPWLSNVLLNGKDDNGDTPLHRIAYNKSLSFFFLGTRFATDARIDNMAFNKKNQNALNILQEDERNFAGAYMGQRLQDKLKQSGVVLGRRIVPNVRKTENVNKTVMKNEGDERGGKLGDTHLLVAILIATVSFAAGFTMPGGYQSDKGPDQGSAILSRSTAFQAFVVTNTIAMTLSSCAVFLNLYSSMYAKRNVLFTTLYAVSMFTLLALVAMVIAFITGTYAVLGHSSGLGITICVLGSLLFFVLYEVMIYDETALRVAIPLVPLSIFFLLIFFLMIKMFAVMGKLRHLCVGSNSSAPKREGRWSNSTPATSTSSQLRSDKEMVVYNRC
uniref:ankyrin repeat-containing protein At5g02620-like n=1 Tax=Fragaria vesca subsp. vesca TaxID=101020 RepID=UPI0005C8A190|nr:PREDICTED: ankyrin repeat-containing protein At5g02620-like [Fragaria vesca subsp. vesca]